MKQWLITIALTVVFLASVALFAEAATLYDIEGIFAPTFVNDVAPSFVGQVTFPGTTIESGTLTIGLTNEFDLNTGTQFFRDVDISLINAINVPYPTRIFTGDWNGTPVMLQWVDYDGNADTGLSATGLDGGGGWDAWAVSFGDYPAGSIYEVKSVPEPGGVALAMMGVLAGAGGMFFRRR